MIENPTKEQLKTLKGIIYCIINIVNNKKYIGKTVNSFCERYTAGEWWIRTSNQYLRNAFDKYGNQNFKISIIEFDIKDDKILKQLEIKYIKQFNSLTPNGYNLTLNNNQNNNQNKNKFAGNKNCKNHYILNNKTNEIIYIKNLRQFCKNENISYSALVNVTSGRTKFHKHYTLPNIILNKWTIISPDNIEYVLFEGEIRPFCRKMNIQRKSFMGVLNKKIKQFKGWKLKGTMITYKYVCIQSPTGDIFEIQDGKIREFERLYDLNHGPFGLVLRKKLHQYKGWRLPLQLLK